MIPAPEAAGRDAGLWRGWGLFLAVCLLLLGIAGLGAQALAQTGAGDWAEPVNVSRSGAASDPVVVVLPDGTLRILWWDQFEGLMVADGPVPIVVAAEPATGEAPQPAPDAIAWTDPAPAPILIVQAGREVTTPTPIEIMPRIVGDAAGRAQAFWLGQADEETGNQPLHGSRLTPGRISWSYPVTLSVAAAAFDAAADLSGTLHLAYVQPVQVGRSPSGLYYRRSGDGGASWSAPTAVQQSRYLRLLPTDGDALSLTAHNAVSLTVTWQDPRQGQILVARSTDGGATWQPARPLMASDAAPLGNEVVAVPGQPERVLWPVPGEPGSMLAVSSSGDTLALALWDGERWTATRRLDLDLRDPGLGLPLPLGDLRPAFAPLVPAQAGAAGSLAVLGSDAQDDLWITGMGVEALAGLLTLPAGSGAEDAGPVNLSQSGAASDPAIVSGPDGRLHAFWWDRFEGLQVADGVVSASTVASGTEENVTLLDSWSEPRQVPLPVASTPWILSGVDGRVHALWQQVPDLQQAAAGEEVVQPLLYSHLAADGTAWSAPQVLAESALDYDVAADLTGTLHLATLVAQETPASPAGVYYRQIGQDGSGWTAPVPVFTSRYLRLLTAQDAHVRVAADGAGAVYVTWDDPQLERSLLAYSPDGGATWEAPVAVGDLETGSRRARLVTPPGDEALVLWEPGQPGSTCTLYQAPAGAVLDGTAQDGERVLEGLTSCPGDERFLPLAEGPAEGSVLLKAGTGSDVLTLALWDGERWSEPARWGASFEDAETGRSVYLGNVHAALVQGEGATGGALAAVGTDASGDVWATGSQVGDLELVFAEPPPWSAPVGVSGGEAYPGLPAAAVDAQGWLHVLWTEGAAGEPGTALTYARWDGTQWTRPAAVLQSPQGKADQPALVAVGDRLHAVWSSGQSGEVLYSRAFAGDAYAASGWSEPFPLPGPGEVGSRPDIVAGPDGSLHAVYAVPVNEGRGIYYTGSADGGETWSPVRQVFDAAAAGWLMADGPQVAVDARGLLHVAWVRRGLPGNALAQGVYYAGSADGGETWSEPFEVAAGAHAWPQVATTGDGQVHLVWNETGGQPAWWHRWSLDGGQTWTRQERVSGFDAVPAPAVLLDDGGSGALYQLGVATLAGDAGEGPALLLSIWDGQRWAAPEAFPLDVDGVEPGAAAGVEPALGSLQVLFRGESDSGEDAAPPQIWHTGRQLPAVAVTTLPGVAAVPLPVAGPALATAAPAGATHQTLATPESTASFSLAPPPAGESSLPIPVLVAGALAALVVGGVLASRFLWARGRLDRPDLLVKASRAGRRAAGRLQGLVAAIRGKLPWVRTE